MTRFYIATQIERAKDHNTIRDLLIQCGHELTYDWTTHGNVRRTSQELLTSVSHKMIDAILAADVVIVLLPGGKGTHTEFGAALASGKKVIVHCEDEEVFLPTEKTNAFYHHRLITPLICPFGELGKHLPKAIPTVPSRSFCV